MRKINAFRALAGALSFAASALVPALLVGAPASPVRDRLISFYTGWFARIPGTHFVASPAPDVVVPGYTAYLISRAAEQPPILSLTEVIVVVRFFGLARPLARYLDRLLSHDLALRSLSQIRARFYARI